MRYACITVCVGLLGLSSTVHAEDRLKLDQTTIHGNRELPRVTFVIPWRDIDAEIPGWPLQRLVDAPLRPMDMEAFSLQHGHDKRLNSEAAVLDGDVRR